MFGNSINTANGSLPSTSHEVILKRENEGQRDDKMVNMELDDMLEGSNLHGNNKRSALSLSLIPKTTHVSHATLPATISWMLMNPIRDQKLV